MLYVREQVENMELTVPYVKTDDNISDFADQAPGQESLHSAPLLAHGTLQFCPPPPMRH